MTESCPNNHDPDRIEIRPNKTRVCTACRDHYCSNTRRYNPATKTRKVTNTHDAHRD
jgi:hypothetical protein